MQCDHCGSFRLTFVRHLVNVDKFTCRNCGKSTFFAPIWEEVWEEPPQEQVQTTEEAKGKKEPKKPKEPKPPKIRVERPIRERVYRERVPRVRVPRNRPPRPLKPSRVAIAPPRSYVIFNHQDKGSAYVKAMEGKYNHLFDGDFYAGLGFVMTDSDIMGRQVRLERFRELGTRAFFLIPHTARPNLVNDVEPGWPHTTAQFVVSQGHVDVIRAYGYDKPLHPVGWTLTPIRKFKPRKEPRNVLFAPIHPRCSKVDQDVNREVFQKLFKLAKSDDIILTVRFIKNLYDSGLETVRHPNVIYATGQMSNGDGSQMEQMEKADLVISHQTFAWKAVALGIPTLMMAERCLPIHIEPRGGGVRYAKNWEKYVDLIAYPLDILEYDDTLGLMRRAVVCDEPIRDWKRRMIGQPFRKDRFLNALESYL